MRTLNLLLPDAAATERLGAALGAALSGALQRAPDDCVVLHLRGELGAGKTSCVRGLLRALGVAGAIRSPTYTLIETYETDLIACVHVDLYRLRGTADLDGLGLRDYLRAGHLIMIEWPERGGGALPAADLEIALADEGPGRKASANAGSAFGKQWADHLVRDSRLVSYLPNLT